MGIFDNYINLNPNYIPNNMNGNKPSSEIINDKPPRMVYDIKNRFIGYSWYYGEELQFEIKVDEDMVDKSLVVDIYNFRWEHMLSFSNSSSKSILIDVDKSINETLLSGIYYCTVKIINDKSTEIVNKFYIIVN